MSELSGKTVLVTGGAGFVGRHLCRALVGENDVRVLDNGRSGKPDALPAGVTYVEGDVRNGSDLAGAMAGVDVVFHEAAVVSVTESVEEPVETNAVNLDGTLNVLEAARAVGARVVFASSAAIYGKPESVPVREGDRTRPLSPYGVQKLVSDHYVRLYADLYGLDTVALRYFNIFGPGQTAGDYSGVITTFVNRALAGDPLRIDGDGEQTRDFVHISDVVEANLRAATTDDVGEAYNVGTGETVTIRELAETIADLVDGDVPIEHGPAREGDIQESCADISKARERLGYAPAVSLREGLDGLIDSYAEDAA